ncbi:MAG: hypothetical protein KC422_03310 [Trueperaceae bacterium]|nr:hypothetical protein [Trueperaceae bacterium]
MISFINDYFYHFQVAPEAMDYLWNEGWRHFGSYFYRYSILQELPQKHVMPLRMQLDAFKESRIHKRILKKNEDLRVSIVPAFVNHEVHQLFDNHRARFTTNIPESIYVFVSRQPATVPCECLSVCLYKADKLIGISYLDLGSAACSSVFQCFDLAESHRSPGIFMILQSIYWAKAKGMQLYYPGYAYHEASYYDYKKRFSGLEYFDWQGSWLKLE